MHFSLPNVATLVASAAALILSCCPFAGAAEPVAKDSYADRIRPLLEEYCGACHDPADSSSDVKFLTAATAEHVTRDAARWRIVAQQLRNRVMPPESELQPSEEERAEIAGWIEQHLVATACDCGESAPPVTTRRLNRDEYQNTVRDLIGLELDLANLFPTDGSGGEGFDNNGETLFLPPLVMERFLETAEQIVDEAIVTPPLRQHVGPDEMQPPLPQEQRERLLTGNQPASLTLRVFQTGDYAITANLTALGPTDSASAVALKIDGIQAHRFEKIATASSGESTELRTVVHLAAGVHRIAFQSVAATSEIRLGGVSIAEQQEPADEAKQRAHQRLLGRAADKAFPASNSKRRALANNILRDFARRAYRRPVTDDEIQTLVRLYDRGAERGEPFAQAIKLPIKAVLVSPHFLFRFESPPQGPELEPLPDTELAVRLSYFLWSSMPDEELFRAAEAGELSQPAELRRQVRRMLEDEKGTALPRDFVGQWLGTRDVGRRKIPDVNFFRPTYNSEMVADLRDEPTHAFQYLIREDRSVLELLDADYVFVNQQLAELYDLPEIQGEHFRRVDVEGGRRGGVLGMGSVHMLTSFSRRTSPVVRGGWILETLLGTHVPSPPADVPPLPGGDRETKGTSVRERLEEHRDNPSCASCHNMIDPLGFGMENFDVLGRWRSDEGGSKIDARGTLPDGTQFSGPQELKSVLMQQKDRFVWQISKKMLGYALGRSLTQGDDCVVRQLVDALEKNDYRTRTLIEQIVLSTPFRYHQSIDAVRTAAGENDHDR